MIKYKKLIDKEILRLQSLTATHVKVDIKEYADLFIIISNLTQALIENNITIRKYSDNEPIKYKEGEGFQ